MAKCMRPPMSIAGSSEKGAQEKMIRIEKPSIIQAAGNKPKIIEEFIGRVNSDTEELSIARMRSPAGWIEPGQKPEFNEYTIVLKGMLRIATKDGTNDIYEGGSVIVHSGEWVQYSTPGPEGAEYIAVCLPAFSPAIVHRDDNLS
jgi:mannose-6-phosphate isomerase-like protein (cupin superfamily)